MYLLMAECRRCGWLGPAYERKARDDATEDLYCPQCFGPTTAWSVNQEKEQADLFALSLERSQGAQVRLAAYRAARLAQERLDDAQVAVKRCQARLLLQQVNDPSNARQGFEEQRRLLAAEREAAEASLACRQAKAKVRALGEGRPAR
jgi:hypothetical protein